MAIPLTPKHKAASFVTPTDFLKYMMQSMDATKCSDNAASAPHTVILVYQKSLFDFITRNNDVAFHNGYFGKNFAWLKRANNKVAIVGTFGIGAPAAALMLEELIAYGVKSFISIGTAGSLIPTLDIGSIVLCTGALRDEGTSYHYLEDSLLVHPDKALTNKLEKAINKSNLVYRAGHTWTTDGIYRETQEDIAFAASKGAICVEMEAAALFAVAEYRDVALASAFVISDSLAAEAWEPRFASIETRLGLEALYKAAESAT